VIERSKPTALIRMGDGLFRRPKSGEIPEGACGGDEGSGPYVKVYPLGGTRIVWGQSGEEEEGCCVCWEGKR
jgi:hypothetical protein